MRRFDKAKNIRKANLLAEERYLNSKGLLKEEAEQKVKITTSTDKGDLVFIGHFGRLPELPMYKSSELFYFKPEKGGFKFIPKGGVELPDWVSSTKEKFDNIALRGQTLPIDYQMGSVIKTGGEPNRGNMHIPPLILGDNNVTIEKI